MQENEDIMNDSDNENQHQNSYSINSDINEPRYLPSNNIIENNKMVKYSPQNKNEEMLLKSRVISIQEEINIRNEERQELLNKQSILKQELSKMRDKIKSKDGINNVYQNFFDVYKKEF